MRGLFNHIKLFSLLRSGLLASALLLGCAQQPATGPGSGPFGGLLGGATGEDTSIETTLQNSPGMPEIPLAPDYDVDDTKKHIEKRVVGEVVSSCQDSSTQKIVRRVKAQIWCRFMGTNDPFIICGRGRVVLVRDTISHHYLHTKASESDASFQFSYSFNPGQTSGRNALPPPRPLLTKEGETFSGGVLLAALNTQAVDSQQQKDDSDSSTHFQPLQMPGKKYDPFQDCQSNDPAEASLASDVNDLQFFAGSAGWTPDEYEVQKFESKWCPFVGKYINLGKLHAAVSSGAPGVAYPMGSFPSCGN